MIQEINWIAVIIGAVFNMVLGMLWYGPLFGKLWLRLMEKGKEDIEGGGSIMIIPMVGGLVSAFVLALIVVAFETTTWFGGGLLGLLVWAGLGIPPLLTTKVYEGGKFSLVLLFSAYQAIVYFGEGVLFSIW